VLRGSAILRKSPAGAQRPSLVARIRQFLIEAWQELQKVLWPSRQEAIRFTLVVLGVIIIVALFIFICDFGLSRISGAVFNLQP
jgi:preprotein translocase subunit SecE